MHQKGDGSKRQLFRDKMTAQQPIKLSNIPVSTSGTIVLNKGTIIEDVSSFSFFYIPTNEFKGNCEHYRLEKSLVGNVHSIRSNSVVWTSQKQHKNPQS